MRSSGFTRRKSVDVWVGFAEIWPGSVPVRPGSISVGGQPDVFRTRFMRAHLHRAGDPLIAVSVNSIPIPAATACAASRIAAQSRDPKKLQMPPECVRRR
jgi:hypothetical protein